MKNIAKVRHIVFCIAHGMIGFPAVLTASVVGLFFGVAIPVARATGWHNLWAAILGTAIFCVLEFWVAWKILMPYSEWLEPRLCPCFAAKNTRWI
ncbi:MAG TPA: hypothetical protein V6C81_29020 [Planktothrix sp.]|jgi:hypothetical protein